MAASDGRMPRTDFAALAAAIGPEGDPERLLAEGLEAWRRSEVALADLDPDWMAHLVALP